jgi:transposase
LAAYKKNARRLRATLVFVDESGFSLLPTACRTWSPRGQTPILRHCFNWPKLSAISAVTPNPHAYLHLVPGTITSSQVIRFVRHLLRWIPAPLFLLWDGGNPHRSRLTRAALATHRDRLRVYRLPAYAPELNPDEWLWAWLKQHALRGLCPPHLNVLCQSIRAAVRRLRRRPDIIRSFFRACPLSF